MKKKKLLLSMAVILCISALTGCSKNSKENTATSSKEMPVQDEDNSGSTPEESDADSLLSNSDVIGHVVEFSDTGCTVSPVKSEEIDGGMIASAAAEGYEDEKDNINVHYSGSCQFQLAIIDIETGKVRLSDIDVSDIKKQTSLIIYGETSDDHNIEATRVIIVRYE